MLELKRKTELNTITGKKVKIQRKLGEGGQGVVYRVSYDGKSKALKWYHQNVLKNPDRFYENLENNIKRSAPNKSFLWPQDLTEKKNDSFGYIMDLRPNEYKDFSLFLLAKEKFTSVTAMCNTGLQIIEAFRELHNSGYSYQDLNDGNFFVNPKNGNVLICDNDNVAEYGKNLGIAGKCRYMAPEIVLEKAQPGIHTDKFSLAVVLFMLLMNNHPLEGKRSYPPCMTEKLERKIYGEQPLFIFDKDDDSNAPVPGINNNAIQRWSLYPSYVQDKFMEAFSQDALKDPSKRIIEKDWLKLFLRLRSEIFKCRNCGEIFFADPLTSTPCPSCGTEQRFEHHIKLSKINIAIHERTKLYDCYINTENDDFNTLCADMLLNETTASWELKNRSKKTWLVIDKNGKQLSKSAGKTFAPEEGMKIVFGNTIGEVV